MTSCSTAGSGNRALRILKPQPPCEPTPAEEAIVRLCECLHAAFPLTGVAAAPAFAWRGNHLPRIVAPSKPCGHVAEAYHRAGSPKEYEEISRTEISFTPAVPEPERRTEEREKLSVYRSATLRWGSYEALCLIRNISPGGLMGKLHTNLAPGERVTVEIRSGRLIPGHIAWSHDNLVGVQFDERIDVLEVLHAPMHGESGLTQRMPRLRIACPASLLVNGSRQTVNLVDVSQGGAKIEADLLREGEQVTLGIRGLDPHRGVVRWAHDGRAGVAFLSAIPFDALARWALERQAEIAARY